jgi:uncharacterized protein
MSTRAAIDAFLAQPALALVGLSRSGKKFGNIACRELQSKGYRVYPIHPVAEVIDGVRCYRRFADLPEPVTAALVVVPPEQAVGIVYDAVAAGVRHVWLQQGAESPVVLQACENAGLSVVSGQCVLMFAQPKGFHRAHSWVWRVLRKVPA